MKDLDGRHSWDGNDRSRIQPGSAGVPEVGAPQPVGWTGPENDNSRRDDAPEGPRASINYTALGQSFWETYGIPSDLLAMLRCFKTLRFTKSTPVSRTVSKTNRPTRRKTRNLGSTTIRSIDSLVSRVYSGVKQKSSEFYDWTFLIHNNFKSKASEIYDWIKKEVLWDALGSPKITLTLVPVNEPIQSEARKKCICEITRLDLDKHPHCNELFEAFMRNMGAQLPDLVKEKAKGKAYCAKLKHYLNSSKSNREKYGLCEINPTTPDGDGLKVLLSHLRNGEPSFVLTRDHVVILRPDQPDYPSLDWKHLRIAQTGNRYASYDTTLSLGWDLKKRNDLQFFIRVKKP